MNTLFNFFTQAKNWYINHKKWSLIISIGIIILIIIIIKSTSSTKESTTYVLGTSEKGTVVSTVSGTGQVSTSATLVLSPETSGTLKTIQISPGDKVKKGQTLFIIDSTEAQKTLRNAQISLRSAQLSLESFKVSTANAKKTQSTAVTNSYRTLLNSNPEAVPLDINTTKFSVPVLTGNYSLDAEGIITIKTYESSGGISFETSGLVNSKELISTQTSQLVGNSGLAIKFPTGTTSNLSWTIELPNKRASNYNSNYNSYQTALENQEQATLVNGVADLDLQSRELSLQQAENAVIDAQVTLAKSYIRAPFDGIIASIPVTEGQQVSSGTSIGTIITSQQIATVPLNEVDAAKVSLGQKVTMEFDAIDGLTITGKIIQIDTIGTVSQGVVTYSAKIAFDTEDTRVKSGMSVSGSIATSIAQDVLTVPSSAIKTIRGESYVLVATNETDPAPQQLPVVVGISDDTSTQIISGISEGIQVVIKTITTSSKTATTPAPSLLGAVGARGTTGGARTGGGR